MLSRSIYIVVVVLLIGQMLLAGPMPSPRPAPLAPAWLLQDRLGVRLHRAAHFRLPFNFRSPRQRWQKRGPGPQPRQSPPVEVERVDGEAVQPPEAWPVQMQDLLDPAACREVIRQARWEQGRVCPHCGSRQVEMLAGQFTSAGWQRWACQVCRTAQGHPR